jgi:hypothetical protein
MPGYDKTGPMGSGPMTGGARGFCNPANAAGRGMAYGRGFRNGSGMGMGRRFGRGFPLNQPAYNVNLHDELSLLKSEAESAINTLEAINIRITELENTD